MGDKAEGDAGVAAISSGSANRNDDCSLHFLSLWICGACAWQRYVLSCSAISLFPKHLASSDTSRVK